MRCKIQDCKESQKKYVAHCYLGILLLLARDWANCEETLSYAQRILPDDAFAFHCLGLLYGLQGKPHTACRHLETALKNKPEPAQRHRIYRALGLVESLGFNGRPFFNDP
jgi:tetratricopeptide (TPR) repeat protein